MPLGLGGLAIGAGLGLAGTLLNESPAERQRRAQNNEFRGISPEQFQAAGLGQLRDQRGSLAQGFLGQGVDDLCFHDGPRLRSGTSRRSWARAVTSRRR